MNKFREMLAGKKTYLVCASTILGGIIAWASGTIEAGELIRLSIEALIGITLRAGIAKN